MEREEEWSSFMCSTPPPPDISRTRQDVSSFIDYQITSNRRLALVTSGGTTVPLEKNTVRFLDNFSSGRRGSTSAEAFLSRGYAVIFMYRRNSHRPFHRHLTSGDLIDSLHLEGNDSIKIDIEGKDKEKLMMAISLYKQVKEQQMLLEIPFVTVFDYAHLLMEVSVLVNRVGKDAIVYLAAAVSDFYIPTDKMAEHKISSSGELQLSFQRTPKLITPLRQLWAPLAFTVTFKLETDEEVLIPHARQALKKYAHQVVVANLLHTCRDRVTMVTEQGEEQVEKECEEEIEKPLVDYIILKHSEFCKL